MNIKKYLYIGIGVFLVIVFLAAGTTAEFKLSNVTSDVYGYIEKFFSQWSLALGAAGTVILAISVFLFIYENRRREEREKQQAIHALHDEIHWNLRPIITLRFDISEMLRYIEEHHVAPSELAPFQSLETRVFDEMRSRGQLHLLEDLRMDVVFCYGLIDMYNRDEGFKPKHLDILTTLHERLDKVIRDLEAKYKFLPRYVKYEDSESVVEQKSGKDPAEQAVKASNDELRKEYFLVLAPAFLAGSFYIMQAFSNSGVFHLLWFTLARPWGEYISIILSMFLLLWALFLCYLAFGKIPNSKKDIVYRTATGFGSITLIFWVYGWIRNLAEIVESSVSPWYFYPFYVIGLIVIVAVVAYPYVGLFRRLFRRKRQG
jgi:hypothetical protein